MKTRMLAVVILAWAGVAGAYEFRQVDGLSYYSAAELAERGASAADRCRLDVRYPVGVSNFATVVNFHGGGLVQGKRHFAPWPKERQDLDPVAFVGVGYRLLTNATPADCVGDAGAAVAWVLKHVGDYGGDPKKVFVTGISGGGYLTAMVGLDPRWLRSFGRRPTDLAGIAPLTGQMTKHFNVRRVGFEDADPQFLPKVDEWAPLHYAAKDGVPPACFLTGGRDVEWKVRVEENEMLAASLRALGNASVEFHETEGDHGGGVTPSSYFLRDFVMKTVDAGGVGRFAPGEKVAFLGDSITHGGKYVGYLQLFAALRHPGWNVRCLNFGLSGDWAGGGVGRWDWEVAPHKADRVFVMFGMNDVGRDLYRSATPSEPERRERAKRLVDYAANQRRLVDLIAAGRTKTVLMTPSPYDQYGESAGQNLVACNDPGLAACAAIVRRLATDRSLGTVELHRPLTDLLKAHPELHLCGADRVHPPEAGHLLMAALVLDAMGEPATVAQVTVDAKKGQALKLSDRGTRNAVVTDVSATPKGVRFTYAPKALPFPALPEYVADDRIYPLTERLNREAFVICGLEAGDYELAFDGVSVGTFSAAEFAKGVNVALLPTPNQRLAVATADLVKRLVANTGVRRTLALKYRDFRGAKIARDDFAAQDAFLDDYLAKLKAAKSQWYQAHVNIAANYRKNRTRADELEAEAGELLARVNAVRPLVERVTVLPANAK